MYHYIHVNYNSVDGSDGDREEVDLVCVERYQGSRCAVESRLANAHTRGRPTS